MTVRANPERRRDERFREGVAYRVTPGDRLDPFKLVKPDSREEKDYLEIVRLLSTGGFVPDRFYRNGIERDYDELLDVHGIKHLHLGGSTGDVLLYLIEYDRSVHLLKIDSHAMLEDEPIGSTLLRLHQSEIANADAAAAAEKAARIAANASILKQGLKPRKLTPE